MNKKDRPIGVFDSGIGGLTVLKEITKEMPNESTIYLGDTARVPYGIRSPETVTRYSLENTRFLSSKDIKLLVVACNTASSVSLESIKKSISVPIVGVIEPGAKAAVRNTKNKRVGVIGTEATIRSNSYAKLIKSLDRDIEVFQLPCPLFVPIVEEGWTEGEIAIMIAEKYLKNIKDKYIDTLVLGCTHYPLLKGVISKVMGEDVILIDSAVEVAKESREILEASDLRNDRQEDGLMEFYVTDSPERFLKVGELFLGKRINNIDMVNLQ
ncbi:MAG: glutamate racemase [Thermodesulfovibrionales bacterium]